MKYVKLIPIVNKILSEYGSMRLTLRQIYYRLVAGYNYPNNIIATLIECSLCEGKNSGN